MFRSSLVRLSRLPHQLSILSKTPFHPSFINLERNFQFIQHRHIQSKLFSSSPPDSKSAPEEPSSTKPYESPKPTDTPKSSDSSTPTITSIPDGPITWRSLLLFTTVGLLLIAYYNYTKHQKQTAVAKITTIGKAAIGGPFELVNDNKERVTSEDLKGNYMLLYFGFTHCPDICPTEMVKMNEALMKYRKMISKYIKDDVVRIKPVFISVDPRRDTPERLKQYKKNESPTRNTEIADEMMWLTGDQEQIKKVTKAYRVYYNAPSVDEGEEYLVDHSIFFYLVDRHGDVMEYFGRSMTADEVAEKLVNVVRNDYVQQKAN